MGYLTCHQVSYNVHPPPGFTYIPAGNPDFTRKCKEFSQAGDHEVFVVSVSSVAQAVLQRNTIPNPRRLQTEKRMVLPNMFTVWGIILLALWLAELVKNLELFSHDPEVFNIKFMTSMVVKLLSNHKYPKLN